MTNQARQALFISHANPEDNPFTLWLGAKLTALGYEVFADILRLKGGDDWERILEEAIRNKAVKFLLIATPHGVQKQGVRNEITIASQTAKRIKDDSFIVPLRLAPFDAPLQIAHAQYIDFKRGWALGLADLLALLAEAKISRMVPNENADLWQSVQLRGAKPIADTPERLISNWLQIDAVPSRMLFYDFKAGISLGAAQRAIKESLLPVVAFNRGFLSFAPIHQLQEYFGPNLPTELVAERPTDSFLEQGWPDLHIGLREARAKFSDLSRQGFDALFRAKGLCSFEIASGRLAWWPTSARASLKKLSFGWPDGPAGLRQIVGHSRKRGFHWHYGVSCWVRAYPTRHVRVAGRVVFTADGHTPLGDAKRLHRLRRSFCKSWRNDRWRDLLLAFLYWLAEGGSSIEAPMGEGAAIRPLLPPIIVDAPFGIDSPDDKSETTDEESDDSNGPGDGQGEEGADEYAEEMDDNT